MYSKVAILQDLNWCKMENNHEQIEKFFHAYERNFNDSLAGNIHADATANSFADCFIAVSPTGVSCGKADDTFASVIEQGYQYYTSCGVKAMNISGQTISSLDEFHFVNKVQWKCHYDLDEARKGTIDFEVIYFLRLTDQQVRIFGFITGDEQKAFRERGLIADS